MLNQSLKNLSNRLRVTAFILFTLLGGLSGYAQDAAPAAADPAVVAEGKALFTNNCASCHAVTDEKVIGPGLKGINERRPEDWLIKWIKNSQAVIASGDAYAVEIYNKYNKTAMTAFPNLSDDQVRSILTYVDAANVPVAAVAGAAASAAGAASGGEGGTSGLFSAILITILAVMILVLVALLAMVNMLAKTNKVDTAEGRGASWNSQLVANLAALGSHPAFKTGALLLFVLLAGKATIDGAYGIGIHQGYAPKQPIEFSHKLHAGEYKINCNYCHTGVYKGKGANIPSANICMNCHNAIKRESPEIQKIYRAIEDDKPIEWVRVHNLPDLAYFNHAQHTNVGGLQCQQCHGEIEKMEVVAQRSSLTMGWCIDCHRQTNVNAAGNAYYDKLLELHKSGGGKDFKVANIGGLECSKCHY
jgi:mono/diheme cytochrome c family protein